MQLIEVHQIIYNADVTKHNSLYFHVVPNKSIKKRD